MCYQTDCTKFSALEKLMYKKLRCSKRASWMVD